MSTSLISSEYSIAYIRTVVKYNRRQAAYLLYSWRVLYTIQFTYSIFDRRVFLLPAVFFVQPRTKKVMEKEEDDG
jgi:hypothetical protein